MFNVPWAVQCPCGIQLYHLSSVLPPPPPPSLTLILLELLTIFNILRETDHTNFYRKLLIKGSVQKPQARKLSVGGVPAPGASTDEIFPKS